ncbi:ATP-binding protein [Oricola sp.]|uniref:ATP-binding protein n=1 Tax=Oricola sp. TaxID=1979950 RepID=UPI003BAD85DB
MVEPSGDHADMPMTDSSGGSESFWAAVRRRLVSNRFPLVISSALFAALYVYASVPGIVAFGCIAVMVAVSLFAPVRTARARKAAKLMEAPRSRDWIRSEALIDSLPDPVILLDGSGAMQFVNSAARRVFGTTVRPGGPALVRFRDPELHAMIGNALAGRLAQPVEVLERSPIERWFEASIHALPGTDTREISYFLYFRDLSEMRRLDKMRSDFIANASHELRTPLASLGGFIETLSGPARNDAEARDRFLAIMQEQADRMARLIDDLLSLSRLETAFGRVDFSPVDVEEVLRHVVSALSPAAAAADVVIVDRIGAVGGEDCRIWGSSDELIQVFSNLIENAIRYGAIGKRIEVHAERAMVSDIDSIRVSIRDYGPGIAAEYIPRLTERFYRVDVESSRAKKGTGLGLAIVKHIMTRHMGRLAISSEVGKGATFTVTIPVWSES